MVCRRISLGLLVASCVFGATLASQAQVQVTPDTAPAPLQHVQTITLDASAGRQLDPRVDGGLITYTFNANDGTGVHLRYFRVGVDTTPNQLPFGTDEQDFTPWPSGTLIAYSHSGAVAESINVFDTAQPLGAANPFVVNPQAGSLRFEPSIRGYTVAYIDAALEPHGEIVVYDLATNVASRLTNDTATDWHLAMSPDGNTLVWEHCPIDTNHCEIWMAIKAGGAWTVSTVDSNPAGDFSPDTDGQTIAYYSDRPSGAGGVFYRDAAGGAEQEILLPGVQAAPRVRGDFMTFEGQDATGRYDVFLYQFSTNRLWNVTNSPEDDFLPGLSVTPNGDLIVAYDSCDPSCAAPSVHAVTFTVPPPAVSYNVCLLYDPNKAKKSGSTYPIQIQLCDAGGRNVSSPSIVVHAVGVTQLSTNAAGVLDDAGNSNPDFDFRYDAASSSYIFNLKTTGFATGTYALGFTAGADPVTHSAPFQIK